MRRRALLPALLLAALAACGGGSTGPEPDPPVITIAGVEDGQVLDGPVVITVTVSHGTYEALLNGSPFFSGSTVSQPGSYTLVVSARAGEATSQRTVGFELRAGATGLLVRLLNLGANDSGGGGDAILLTDSSAAGARHFLVDAGPAGQNASDPGFVARRLDQLGVDTLEALLLTHAHSDHFAGMSAVLSGTKVLRFVYNGQVRNLSSYQAVLSAASARADSVIVPTERRTQALGLGDVRTELTIVPPLATHVGDAGAGSSEINEGSLGVAVARAGFEMFLAGDGEVEANRRWRLSFGDLTGDVDVLKVGHHGANDAVFDNGSFGSSAWLGHTSPEVHVISSNGITHPRVRALELLRGRTGTRTYCTSVHGEITIRVDREGSFQVSVERNAGSDCVPGSEATT